MGVWLFVIVRERVRREVMPYIYIWYTNKGNFGKWQHMYFISY